MTNSVQLSGSNCRNKGHRICLKRYCAKWNITENSLLEGLLQVISMVFSGVLSVY